MLLVKIFTVLACSALFWWGGYNWHNARRFIMPCILAAAVGWITHSWWALTMLSSIGFLCLGYGIKGPLRHCFGDGWGRGVWGLLVALAFSLGLFLTHHMYWFLFILYLAVNFTLENALKRISQLVGDIIIGAAFGSIVFLIH